MMDPTPQAAPPHSSTLRVRFPLWIKLSVFSSLLAVVPTLCVVLLSLDKHQETLRTLTWERMVTFSELVIETQESIFTDAYSSMESIAAILADPAQDPEQRLALVKVYVSGRDVMDRADVYTATGEFIDSVVEQGAATADVPQRLDPKLMAQALDARYQVAYGDPVMWGQDLRVPMLVPIRARGELTGFVSSHILLERLQKRVKDLGGERPGFRAYVVDQKQRLLADSDPEDLPMMADMSGHAVAQTFAEGMSLGVGGTQPFVGADEVERLGAMRPIAGRRWAVMVDAPLEIAYQVLDEVRRVIYAILLATLLVALTAALILSRSLTAPIDRLMHFARALAQRSFDEPLKVGTRDELAVLGSVMQQSAREIKAGEEKLIKEEAIRHDLGRYLPREVVERVISREQDMALGGQRRQISVLFADVVQFTPLTENLEPEQVVAILNQLFTILTEIVFRHEGTVDKFIGDSVMAFWGAPDPVDDHAERAVEAAEDMLRWLDIGNANWRMEHQVSIELAIGIATGEAIVGNIGSEDRMAYTAIGHIVNTAARLEAIAQPGQILITGDTEADLPHGRFELVACGEQHFPGSVQAVTLFEVKL